MRRGAWLAVVAVCVALAGVGVAAGRASADILWLTPTVTPISGGFEWSYPISIDSSEDVNPGNFTTLYDFNGLFGTPSYSGAVTGAISVNNTGITPSSQKVEDDPSIPNITVTFTGTTSGGAASLGTVTADSVFGSNSARFGVFASQATASDSGLPIGNQGTQLEPTPEPASLALLALALPFVGGVIRRRVRGN
jgi:hypothetical protein